MNFIALDFETATRENYSACSIGLCFVENMQICHTEHYLIQPPGNRYLASNTGIHGIRPEDTENAPQFPEVWEKISSYFNGETVLIAHNAQFDMSVLDCCLKYYEIPKPTFSYADTLSLSRWLDLPAGKRSLAYIAECLGIPNDNHHDAANDAFVCAKIAIECLQAALQEVVSSSQKDFADLSPSKAIIKKKPPKPAWSRQSYEYSDIEVCSGSAHPLCGKQFCITGEFEGVTRLELAEKFARFGAIPKNSVVKSLYVLFVGQPYSEHEQGAPKSSKLNRAEKLNSEGANVQIVYDRDLPAFLLEAEMAENCSDSNVSGISP